MKKVVIFDLDGTLLDTSVGILSAVKYVIKELGLDMLADEVIESFIGPPIYESFKKYYSLDDKKLNEATELFRNIYKDKYLYYAEEYHEISKVLRILKKKEYLLAVATNKRFDYVKPLLDKFGILVYFDSVNGTDFNNTHKKSDVIRMCLEDLAVSDKEKVYMVGDTVNDFEGAKANDINFLGVTYGFGVFGQECECSCVDKPIDVADFIISNL